MEKKNEARSLDKRDSLRVVTANEMILFEDLANLSLNAKKLLYIAIAQCREVDESFYTYTTTPTELAEMWGIDRSHVYRDSLKITTELMKIVIREETNGKKSYKLHHLFETCKYDDDKVLTLKLHSDMAEFLLGQKGRFSKPKLWDFVRMRSPYSIAIWHLMQREMHSYKPMMTSPIEFDLTLEELRRVTGCTNKLKQIGQFKERVLDKAIREIRENALVSITYTNVKRGRTVVGFRFTAESPWGTVKPEDMTLRQRQQIRKGQLIQKKAAGTITEDEKTELDYLNAGLYQRTIEDYTEGYDE